MKFNIKKKIKNKNKYKNKPLNKYNNYINELNFKQEEKQIVRQKKLTLTHTNYIHTNCITYNRIILNKWKKKENKWKIFFSLSKES